MGIVLLPNITGEIGSCCASWSTFRIENVRSGEINAFSDTLDPFGVLCGTLRLSGEALRE